VLIGIRPEYVHLSDNPVENTFKCVADRMVEGVSSAEFFFYMQGKTDSKHRIEAALSRSDGERICIGQEILFTYASRAFHYYQGLKVGIINLKPLFVNKTAAYLYWTMELINGRTTMKLSARNVLKGKVVQVKAGAVNSEVILELPAVRRWSQSSPKNPLRRLA